MSSILPSRRQRRTTAARQHCYYDYPSCWLVLFLLTLSFGKEEHPNACQAYQVVQGSVSRQHPTTSQHPQTRSRNSIYNNAGALAVSSLWLSSSNDDDDEGTNHVEHHDASESRLPDRRGFFTKAATTTLGVILGTTTAAAAVVSSPFSGAAWAVDVVLPGEVKAQEPKNRRFGGLASKIRTVGNIMVRQELAVCLWFFEFFRSTLLFLAGFGISLSHLVFLFWMTIIVI